MTATKRRRPIRLTTYRDRGGKLWRWRAKAGNGRVIDASEQGYVERSYARKKAQAAHPEGILSD